MLQRFDPRNADPVVNVNGPLLHRDEAGVGPFGSAVQGGDAVWEGLRLDDGRILRLDDHLARLERSARALAFAEAPLRERILREIRRTLDANGMDDGVHIRLTLSRGVKATSGMDPRLNRSGPTLILLAEWKPPVYDEAEITYFTFPGHEGQGVATAMVSMLLDVAETHAPGIRLTAQTLIRRNASHRVLEKVGFVEQKTISNLEDGSVLQWVHVAVEPQDCAGGVGV